MAKITIEIEDVREEDLLPVEPDLDMAKYVTNPFEMFKIFKHTKTGELYTKKVVFFKAKSPAEVFEELND